MKTSITKNQQLLDNERESLKKLELKLEKLKDSLKQVKKNI